MSEFMFSQGAESDAHLDFHHDGSLRLHDPDLGPNSDAGVVRSLPVHGFRFFGRTSVLQPTPPDAHAQEISGQNYLDFILNKKHPVK